MSIAKRVEELVYEGKLIARPSTFSGASARNMYLIPDIETSTRAPFADTVDGVRYGELAAYLDAFCELNEITVCQSPLKKPHDVMLARVDPADDQFWSMRITDPESTPGIRLLGAFCGLDSFVGLACEFRERIADFDEEVASVKALWRDLFGNLAPHSGSSLDEYLTNYLEQ